MKKFSSQLPMLGMLVLMDITTSIETDIYVPGLPQIIKDLACSENAIQSIFSLNLIGICLASLICGPLSDRYGRKRTLLLSFGLFLISSVACTYSSSLSMLATWRFIQGIGSAAPLVIGTALLLELYSIETAAALIGILNSISTATIALAPLLGTWLNEVFSWRATFAFVSLLALGSWIGILFFIPKSIDKSKSSSVELSTTLKGFIQVLKNPSFLVYSVICTLTFGCIMVYLSNLSLVLIDHLKISLRHFGLYQSITMVSFCLSSILSGLMIKKYSVGKVKDFSLFLISTGGLAFFLIAVLMPTSALAICLSMGLFVIGVGLGVGSLGASAIDAVPTLGATASSALTAMRLGVTALMVSLSGQFFNGTIFPSASIVLASSLIILLSYLWLKNHLRNLLT